MDGIERLQAVILAGGRGTRLRACVSDRPKPLAPVAGLPFVEWILRRLAQWGVRDVLLCVGYRARQIREQLGTGQALGLRIIYSEEVFPLGTAGALRLALPYVATDPVLVLNGDSYCEVPYDHLLAFHRRRSIEGTLALVKAEDAGRYGSVDIDGDGYIVRFAEKAAGHAGSWINAGCYLLTQALLGTIPTGRCVSLEREMFPKWLGRLAGFAGEWPFLDIGTPESYRRAGAFLVAREVGQAAASVGERGQ
ncbi:MAG: hypothetical protein KatS3mg082_1684 [Nitrospiraceae bacterium]|nr:MAG: hypothetical protein KatS3mg082_1684 [Nitrospiraceae bacterium]